MDPGLRREGGSGLSLGDARPISSQAPPPGWRETPPIDVTKFWISTLVVRTQQMVPRFLLLVALARKRGSRACPRLEQGLRA